MENCAPHLHVAIPAMDELEWLPRTLESIASSVFSSHNADGDAHPITVYVCVNQPDDWWLVPQKQAVCESNRKLLEILREERRFPIVILDHSSRGNGWIGKNYGVGWARKILFSKIFENAADEDILISMDADTVFGPNYLASILYTMSNHPEWLALSVPYYHRLTGNELYDRSILRYEIFMRNYALNMLSIGSPYSFTAIGSAIACQVRALKKIGGITPMKSGEDFYLLQKLRKMGEIGDWNEECVYPAARFSDRVAFGTGPAMQKGAQGDWHSYPIYHHRLFEKVKETYEQLEKLYEVDIDSEFIRFLQEQFKNPDLWSSIRQNVKSAHQFARAFHEKADGLRILQFLKMEQNRENIPDEVALQDNLQTLLTDFEWENMKSLFSSNQSLNYFSVTNLAIVRDKMFEAEMRIRKQGVRKATCR